MTAHVGGDLAAVLLVIIVAAVCPATARGVDGPRYPRIRVVGTRAGTTHLRRGDDTDGVRE